MQRIKEMSVSLANQIAAGEVVERPASIVKELVENAIDAGASHIMVELKEAGIQQIIVTDDGEGMSAEDLPMAFLPHATSKIYHSHDLFNIRSLGFRGEALASIASVSKVRLDSRTVEDSSGHYIIIEGSEIIEEGISRAKKGSRLIVNSLFYNTPARLKHLKSLKTELMHSLNFLQNISMAYPGIRFQLSHDDQLIFHSAGRGDLQQAIANVYQASIARDLIPISASNEDFTINAYISKPTLSRSNKNNIHWFINQRVVKSYLLDKVLINAYQKQLMIGRYPLAVIHIQLDAHLLDVNVHPSKQTVRLSKEDELSQLLHEAVTKALQANNPVPQSQPHDLLAKDASQKSSQLTLTNQASRRNLEMSQAQGVESGFIKEVDKEVGNSIQMEVDSEMSRANVADTQESLQKESKLDLANLRYVGQIHGTYLIAEGYNSFFLIDQHAAQERIRYEAFMKSEYDVAIQQQLLFPLILHFDSAEQLILEEAKGKFQELGIYLEPFGPRSYQLESYPTWMADYELEEFVRDITSLLADNEDISIAKLKEKSLIMQSCRGAIKANHYLDANQARALIQDMNALEDPYHCPHGRPVFVEITANTLEKLFKRIPD